MTQDVGKPGTSTAAVPLTDQQAVVLQAIYDHFREHGTWPTFITIDRPIRRERRWDTGAILLGLPESLIVEPRPGHLRPIERDELRLRLLGIQACEGSSDDTARFVRTLRWLAEREETYEPPPGSSDEMPQVTSQEIADHLGLDGADELSLQRIYAMLQLDHWGLGGSGSNDDSWYVRLGQDIWRFRDVQTIEDVISAREAWLAEGRPVTAQVSAPEGSPWYHIAITTNSSPENSLSRLDLSHDELESQFLAPYREGRPLMTNGRVVRPDDIRLIQITQTEQSFEELRSRSRSLIGQVRARALTEWGVVATNGTDVTDDFITGAPGQPAMEAIELERLAPPAQIASPYVDAKVIAAIQAKDGQSTFDVTKLLALIAELNDNCARSNTYASHALLRGLLDHIPPILSCKNFEEVANNYRWPQTDKKYLKQLAAFRAQGDDALHRQISADADLLGFDDMPKSVCVDRLLLECAKKL